jgi:hypothetical protein
MEQLFKQVFINGKEDLPTKIGGYWIKWKKGSDDLELHWFEQGDKIDAVWNQCIEFYLQPLPEQSGPADKDIKKEAKLYDRSAYCGHYAGDDLSVHFSNGANWFKSHPAPKEELRKEICQWCGNDIPNPEDQNILCDKCAHNIH